MNKSTAFYDVIKYLEDLQDAECLSGGNEYTPNEEMKLLMGLKEWHDRLHKLILDDVPHQYQERLLRYI